MVQTDLITISKTLRRKLEIRKYFNKSLKLPKRQSKPINRRRTDNTMAKTKEKGQKTSNYRYLQNTTQKTKDSEIFQDRVEDIKREIRSRRSKKDRQYNY
jgi:cation transport regulator ChaC